MRLHRSIPGTLASLCVVAGVLAFASAPAFAKFSRPFLGEIKGTPAGPFQGVGGIATAPTSGGCGSYDGHLWIGEPGTGLVNEFGSSDEFIASLPGFTPRDFAFDQASCTLESSDESFGRQQWVAVDNSVSLKDPARGDIYRAFEGDRLGEEGEPNSYVRRVTSAGAPAPFTCPAGITSGYIKEGELIGTPQEAWTNKSLPSVEGIAVNSSSGASAGDIYVINRSNFGGAKEIDQFTPDGCFERAITGSPSESFGGAKFLTGMAVDPTHGDVIVTVDSGGTEHAFFDEFSSEGKYLGQFVGTPSGGLFGGGAFGSGVAVNSAGDLYVSDVERDVVNEFGPGAFLPAVVTGEVEDDRSTSAVVTGTFRGAKNEEEHDLVISGCDFEVVAETVFKASEFVATKILPCVPAPVGKIAGEEDHLVHAEAASLTEGETYEYRLVVTTEPSEHGGTQDGAVESFAAAAAPAVRGVSVGNISSSFADFSGEIDPRGSDTTYLFQYIDAAGYEAALAEHASDPYAAGASVPVTPADVGSGDRYVSVSVQAGGLAADTTYHYRVVASNGSGVTDGADGAFATLPAGLQGLPGHRAYELVTPANKGDAEDMFEHVEGRGIASNEDVGYASEDGDQFLLMYTGAAFGPFPASGGNAYVFSRGKDGWSFKSVVSPTLGVQSVSDLVFDPLNFSVVGIEDRVSGEEKNAIVDLDGPPGGPFTATAPSDAGAEGAALEREAVKLVGGSSDLGDVAEESTNHKLPLCSAGEEQRQGELYEGVNELYQWSSARGCLSLVNLQSGGAKPKLISACGATLGLRSGGDEAPGGAHNAVSADGSKIFFTAPAPFATNNGLAKGKVCWDGSTSFPPQLYMRVDGETTVKVSKPAPKVTPEGVYPAIYVGAAADGSRVFFMTKTQLTPDASAIKTRGQELYEYDPKTEQLKRISGGDLKSGPVEGNVLDVPAVAEDGSAVYFNAEGNLTPQAQNGGLYRYDTETGETTYVAEAQPYPNVLSSRGAPKAAGTWYEEETRDLIAGLDLEAPYETTRGGQFLLFGAYRYDAADDSTVCVMCNPNGSGPIPDASFTRSAPEEGNPAGGPVTAMSENGEYVFFDTAEPLVPQATNGKIDVYEWHDGSINLISSGQSSSPDFFLGSSSYVTSKGETVEGGNVFFGTHSQLVPADTDNSGDLYDARICTAEEPCIKPAEGETAQCEGSSCQTPPAEPIDQTPTSLAFNGPSNPPAGPSTVTKKTTPKCKRGFVKKKVKKKEVCVKSKSKKKARAKKASRDRRVK